MSVVYLLASSHKSRHVSFPVSEKERNCWFTWRDELQLVLLQNITLFLHKTEFPFEFWGLLINLFLDFILYLRFSWPNFWFYHTFWSFHFLWGWGKWREYQNRACKGYLCLWGIRPISVVSVGIILLTKCLNDFWIVKLH